VPTAPTILFVGDIVGGLGRRTLLGLLPALRERHAIDFVVVNGENIAGGLGITPKLADDLFAGGVDAITLGNHTYRRQEIGPYLESGRPIIRPANYLASQPGRGFCIVEKDGVRLGVVNLSGNLHLRAGRVAFLEIDNVLSELDGKVDHILVDMHAELTSEKIAMGWYLDGRVTAVVGTHTHVPTADLRVLPGLHHRRRHDGPARRRARRQEGAVDRVAAHAHDGALRDQRGRPLADGRCHPVCGAAATCRGDRASARAVATSAASSSAFLTPTATTAQACW
jgi:metallophosphoesterase (TIGR00282 family)